MGEARGSANGMIGERVALPRSLTSYLYLDLRGLHPLHLHIHYDMTQLRPVLPNSSPCGRLRCLHRGAASFAATT